LQELKNTRKANIYQVKEIKMDNVEQPSYAILFSEINPILQTKVTTFEIIFFDETSSKTYIIEYGASEDRFQQDIEMLKRSINTFQIISPQNGIFDICITDPTNKNCVRDSSEDLISKLLGENNQSESQNRTTDMIGNNQFRS
jgi:hypothetical protein